MLTTLTLKRDIMSKPELQHPIISKAAFQKVLPKTMGKAVNDELVNSINSLLGNEVELENMSKNILGFTSVLKDGRYNLKDYVNACKFVTWKLLGDLNIDAYVKTFPERYERLVSNGKDSKHISAYVAAYNKTQLVQQIFKQTLTPFYVFNQDKYQQALDVQVGLMLHANSETVRMNAAESVMKNLTPPEDTKIELDISVKEDSAIAALKASVNALTERQRHRISNGIDDAQDIAHSTLLSGDTENE